MAVVVVVGAVRRMAGPGERAPRRLLLAPSLQPKPGAMFMVDDAA